jgi:hypothetical protein
VPNHGRGTRADKKNPSRRAAARPTEASAHLCGPVRTRKRLSTQHQESKENGRGEVGKQVAHFLCDALMAASFCFLSARRLVRVASYSAFWAFWWSMRLLLRERRWRRRWSRMGVTRRWILGLHQRRDTQSSVPHGWKGLRGGIGHTPWYMASLLPSFCW